MNDKVVQLVIIFWGAISALGSIITGVAAWGAWRTGLRNEENLTNVAKSSEDNAAKIEQVHLATNSMKDALVASTRVASLMEGKVHEQEAQRLREAQTAALVTALADPAITQAEVSAAGVAASRPL